MTHSDIERELCALERLITRITPHAALSEPAPLARWRTRLESILECDGLIPSERAHLVRIIAIILSLECRMSNLAAH
ncbi:hypothetical protein Bsp3421_000223 (plasmid) [Burkholderia sp. FERM BP-3421]|uniref:hypothetical protein n=1 Tax=Burkholderia sp. FERM BP-3421 TaxID=1494466 RepID=UPI00235FFB72|nr:hypothetical protein [Burkholderia sp. FERM BP-3421]WDD90387.1 hypothetical protein Bsp3421_000223 [Burkholderia sp. FERM BP-3421]